MKLHLRSSPLDIMEYSAWWDSKAEPLLYLGKMIKMWPWFCVFAVLYFYSLQSLKNQGLIRLSPIPGVKWIECSWPSTRKTKLKENWKMNKQYYQSRTGFITQSALIAALYVVLTMIVAPIAFGPIQFRVSEVLCVLPYFLTSAVPGVTIGCFLANLLCGAASLDVSYRITCNNGNQRTLINS